MPTHLSSTAAGRARRVVASFLLALGAGAVSMSAQAQAPASTAALIQRGGDLFEDQQYEESIQTLSAALVHPGSSLPERIEIYRLLAYNFIILKRSDEADAAVRGLLVLDGGFSLPPTESPRFRDFFDATRKQWEEEGKPGAVVEGEKAAPKPVRLVHASPAEAPPGIGVKLTGTIEDEDARVRGVQLAYRAGAKGRFVTVPVTITLGSFRAQIPTMSVKPPLVEYYLQAVDQGGLPIASRGDATAPLRIAVPAPVPAPANGSALTSPWFWVPVGVVVIGSAVATAIILSSGGDPSPTSTVSVRVTE